MRGLLIAAAVLSAAACLWGAMAGPVPLLSPLVWIGALWLPGAWLALPVSGAPRSRMNMLWMPLAYGPVLFGAGVCAGRLAGLPLVPAAAGVVVLAAAALIARVLATDRGRVQPPRTGDTGGASRLVPLGAGLAVLALGMIPPLTHEPLRFWGDALLHLPIMERVLAGGFPPRNPFLAGMPVGYFWFYHVTLAPVSRLSGLPLEWIPVLVSAQALLVLLLALDRAGRDLGLSVTARAAALLLVGIGLTPWGWVRLLVFHAAHPQMNWALVRAYGMSALLPILNPADPRLAASLTKVAVSNALPMSLALAALAFAAPRPGAWAGVRRAVLVAGCLAFHLATGLLLAAGLGVRWAATRLGSWRAGRHAEAAGGTAGNGAELVSVAAGVLVAVPYLLLVLRARQGSPLALGWHGGHALELHLSLAGLWILCFPILRAWWRDPERRGWLAIGLPALVLPFAAHLVDGNEYKGIFFLLVLLAPAAGAGLDRMVRRRAWLAALVLCLFLPTPLLVAQSLQGEIPDGYLSPDARRAVHEMGERLPAQAVVWTPDAGSGYSPFTLPLDRAAYLSDPYALKIMGQWQGPEAAWRRASLAPARDGTPEGLAESLKAARDRLGGRPLAVLVTPTLAARYPYLEANLWDRGFELLARHPLLALYLALDDGSGSTPVRP